jgi:hypothetical protein
MLQPQASQKPVKLRYAVSAEAVLIKPTVREP